MTAVRYLVIIDDTRAAKLIEAWLVVARGVRPEQIKVFGGSGDDDPSISRRFEAAANWIDRRLDADAPQGIPSVVAITDFTRAAAIDDLNPMGQRGANSVLGMLILAYPEIDWVFANAGPDALKAGSDRARSDLSRLSVNFAGGPRRLHERLDHFTGEVSPMFDGTGLRNRVRGSLSAVDKTFSVVRRSGQVVALDEEKSYAWLHAYIGYRFGYLAQAATTLAGLTRVVPPHAGPPTIVFEDACVDFADDESGCMALGKREDLFPWLRQERRRFITSGSPRDEELLQAGLWTTGDHLVLDKPVGGIFCVHKEAEIPPVAGFPWPGNYSTWGRLKRSSGRSVAEVSRYGRQLYQAVPDLLRRKLALKDDATRKSHAVPGRVLLVAERLIERARSLPLAVESVPVACRGAVLAADAFELLAARTPTLALDALSLKHQFEVLAECQFLGMQHHMELGPRLWEIEDHARTVTRNHGTARTQRRAAWNAELAICNGIISILRRYNRFDEEHRVLARTRRLHRVIWLDSLWSTKNEVGNGLLYVVKRPFALAGWYFETIINGLPSFLIAIALWLGLFGVVFAAFASIDHAELCVDLRKAVTDAQATGSLELVAQSYWQGLAEAFLTFVAVQPTDPSCVWAKKDGLTGGFALIALTMAAGFVHLGVLVSHMYSLMLRR